MLDGLTNRPAAELAVLARSWASPPAMVVEGSGFAGHGYDPAQRAFVLDRQEATADTLQLSFQATPNSPLLNPALVVHAWGEAAPALTIDGKAIAWGNDARFGFVRSLDGPTLVVWIRFKSTSTTSLDIHAAENLSSSVE
jgi:hypothetical protein